jgi:hypothetical protein
MLLPPPFLLVGLGGFREPGERSKDCVIAVMIPGEVEARQNSGNPGAVVKAGKPREFLVVEEHAGEMTTANSAREKQGTGEIMRLLPPAVVAMWRNGGGI